MARPNILWICTDEQRWDTLGCYGNEFVRTPVLDKLAEDSLVFDGCYAQSPVCTPSRASFLTGRYPRTTRTRQNGQDIPSDEVLVTRLLADAGYTCGLSGKLHISASHTSVAPVHEHRIDDGYSVFHWCHDPFQEWKPNLYHEWLREHGREPKQIPHPCSKWVHVGPPGPLSQAAWCAEMAMDFMRAQTGVGKPWLMSVNIYDPHHPFDPPGEYLERYEKIIDDIPLPNYVEGELDSKPVYQEADRHGAYDDPTRWPYAEMSDFDHRLVRAAYWAMCDLIDDQVGRMLQVLRETGQLDNTIVIFTSDHGEMLGDHGMYCKGPYFYEPAIRVPLLVSWPGVIVPGRSSSLVELTDLAQTLLDATEQPHHPGMQGKSFWPMLTGKADRDHHRDDVYCEYYYANIRRTPPQPHLTMVRTRSHKLVLDHPSSTGEVYDLEADPNETVNLWDDPACERLKTQLLIRLCNRMAWTVDPLPERRARH